MKGGNEPKVQGMTRRVVFEVMEFLGQLSGRASCVAMSRTLHGKLLARAKARVEPEVRDAHGQEFNFTELEKLIDQLELCTDWVKCCDPLETATAPAVLSAMEKNNARCAEQYKIPKARSELSVELMSHKPGLEFKQVARLPRLIQKYTRCRYVGRHVSRWVGWWAEE